MNIYVASSWRNEHQPPVVAALREAGCEVYDFHDPAEDEDSLSWRDVYQSRCWSPSRTARVLWGVGGEASLSAAENFASNVRALERADAVLLVMPCGTSAHAELGWAVGAGKRTAILLLDYCEAELMWKMADDVLLSIDDAVKWAEAASATNS